jgi:thioredoxin reductase
MPDLVDAVVVGGGPAGLAAATSARRSGVERVVVLERDACAGGIPLTCRHSPFGMREFHRVLSGQAYAQRLVEQAQQSGVDIRTSVHVVKLGPHGELHIATRSGLGRLQARRVILATGARETPRSARLVSGSRPFGVSTTGELQNFVNTDGQSSLEQSLLPFPLSSPLSAVG